MSTPLPRLLAPGALFLCFTLAQPLPAAWPAVTFSGDVRLRFERDWDSSTGAGTARPDRDRARARARLAASLKFSEEWSFGARLRTGNPDSQQSPHLTFWSSDHQEDDLNGALDRYFLQYKEGPLLAWFGRNNLPFWQQNEMVWDEDVTPTGLALTYEATAPVGQITASGGAFLLPDGMWHLHGEMMGGQLRLVRALKPAQLTLASSLYLLGGAEGARHLRNRNGARDYAIAQVSAQWTRPLREDTPLTLGLDLIENLASYSAADVAPFPATHRRRTSGYVASVLLGQLRRAGDWQLGYFYAWIEPLAVNAAYAQDDWARFGSSTQSDVTDIKGHELRAGYAFSPTLNLSTRLFIVDAITSRQDGNRLRVDLNWRF